MVNYPEERKHFCVRENKHTAHKCSIYKKGKDSLLRQGKRRYDRKQRGWGGQTKPIFHKKAKVTKKNTIKMICKSCKCTTFKVLKRCHKLEIQRMGAAKKQKGAFEY
ncbi:Ribosomal_protein L44 [Hexamita inflata]|uniref:Ribosomal protein L44 n=1 Tax=Hexamita inflata TaxID=28002 RepID=A0AA86P9F5_9EUKA|nr:Ribosomal protein L44 [Hexamita inflata]CAI9940743.1 Ribosomal protein L44 [Hexamita inflata]CAI9952068.1 Ribosomal protein L44 [Hexamita inflata]